MNYYYLAASLPMLFLGRTPLIGEEDFLALCREHLAPEDMEGLESLWFRGGEGSAHAFVAAWRGRETALRNAIVEARAARLGRDAAPYLREAEPGLPAIRAVGEAFGRATPAEREFELDRFRWQTVEEVAGLDIFSGAAVLGYGLKLRMAHRWAGMAAETGRKRLEETVDTAAAASP